MVARGTPGLAFQGDPDTRMRGSADELQFYTGKVQHVVARLSRFELFVPLLNDSVNFATLLATPVNGMMIYCSDCTKAMSSAGAGTGAFAKRNNGAWDCN